ncbi:trimethylamine---corrinoid protein Co-methyltransferase [Candidatus Hakubella thermalkaliphila]|uniref:Trimethylamine---corrinoid protein Co-methyltransferase n=1 Tax=Candidatus Hakubella thermalkaliphila TaxID=2754717 RepID=A0A6V8NNT6_9ACTN|nr:trimethylamine methyltransferase family protein [Candidatus Hakubella thermalkaliphila]GFP21935.1 trimethylamine---corrinoid protein Co-methyltransferase [Candidatus Hakubella thermalkaliphila]
MRCAEWEPRICDRENWESWLTCGGKNMLDNAVEEKERILREHISEPLDDDMQKEIDDIVAAAERELLS